MTEILAYFLLGRAKGLSANLVQVNVGPICERCEIKNEGGVEHTTYSKSKEGWLDCILRRNCLIKQIIEEREEEEEKREKM